MQREQLAGWMGTRVRRDCRHFLGDRPCDFHKADGRTCEACREYAPIRQRILIVKLDALGDVLRTTAILPAIARRWPQAAVTWLTRPEAAPLLAHNPYLSEVWPLGPIALARLAVERFDVVLGLDPSREAAALASAARGGTRRGFTLQSNGQVVPLNPEAGEWFLMGVSDPHKRANTRTYQEHIARIAGLPADGMRIVFCLRPEEERWAREERLRLGLGRQSPLVGVNLGGGGRWQRKPWTLEHVRRFLALAAQHLGGRVLLFGGDLERDQMDTLAVEHSGFALATDTAGDVRRLGALLGLCEVLVTGDTLALHAAVGLGVPVVALFGPTAAAEVDLQGNGTKILSDLDCLCCYRTTCTRQPSCMERIAPERVLQECAVLLARRGWERQAATA